MWPHAPRFLRSYGGCSACFRCERLYRGYTLLPVSASNAGNAALYDNLSLNFIRDIAPVTGIMRVPSVMTVHPGNKPKYPSSGDFKVT